MSIGGTFNRITRTPPAAAQTRIEFNSRDCRFGLFHNFCRALSSFTTSHMYMSVLSSLHRIVDIFCVLLYSLKPNTPHLPAHITIVLSFSGTAPCCHRRKVLTQIRGSVKYKMSESKRTTSSKESTPGISESLDCDDMHQF